MAPQTRNTVLGSLAVVVVGTLLVMYLRSAETSPVDSGISSVSETFTCSKCGAKFPMTVAEQAEMIHTKGSIICAKCGAPGADKPVIIRVDKRAPAEGLAESTRKPTSPTKPNEPEVTAIMPAAEAVKGGS